MPDRKPVKYNDRGHEIWFVPSEADGGTYSPVHRNGCLVFAAAFLWIQLCGLGGMIAFLFTWSPWSFVGMFVAGVPGLVLMARTVRRHS